jgi:hypothetical protein
LEPPVHTGLETADGRRCPHGYSIDNRQSEIDNSMSPLYIARSREIAARALDGEMMIMSARDSTLFNLNELGTMIWQAADGATSLEDIVSQKICVEYEVEPDQALPDAEAFVREMAEHGIMLVSDQPIKNSAD